MNGKITFHRTVLVAAITLLASANSVLAQSLEAKLFVVTTATTIDELDPSTGAVLGSIPKPEQVSPGPDGLAFDGTSLYYISAFGTNNIFVLEPDSGTVQRTLTPGISCSVDALAHSGAFLFGLCYDTREIHRIDPTTGESQLIYQAASPILGGMTFAGVRGTLFVSSENNVLEVDPENGTLVGTLDIGMQTFGLGYSNAAGLMFAGTSNGTILALNPTDGSVSYSFSVGAVPYAMAADEARVLEGRYLAVIPSSLDFGVFELGSTVSKTVRLYAGGTEPVTVSTIEVAFGDIDLSDVPLLPVQIEPGEVVSFSVGVTPVVEGAFEGTISITSDDTTGPTKSLPVSGDAITVHPAEPGILYASTGGSDGGRFITIDAASGAGALIGDPPSERLPGIAIDSEGRVFAADPQGVLYRLDAGSGLAVGQVSTGLRRMAALSFDSSDVLFAVAFDQGFKLFTIEPTTGAAEAIANVESFEINGMSFSPIDGTLWAASTDEILTIDSSTGLVSLVGSAGLFNITDLQFDLDGTLYATVGGGNEENRLAIIDQSTGAASAVGPIGFSSVSGLAARLGTIEGPHLAVLPPRLDFGQVETGEVAERSIVLRNVGTEAVTVTAITSPIEPFLVDGEPLTLPLTLEPGEQDSVALEFSPVVVGTFEDGIVVSSDDADQPEKSVRLVGRSFELAPADPGLCYGSTGGTDGGRLLLVDTITGSASLIADAAADRLPGLAIDLQGNVFASHENWIERIDAVTGETVRLGSSSGVWLTALAFDSVGTLYGVDDESLYRVDRTTGRTFKVGATGITGIRGLTVDPTDNALWASSGATMWQLDKSSGAATFRGNTGVSAPLTDIAFDPSGSLFGVSGGAQSDNLLVSIDKNTQAATVIGPLGFSSVSGLACDVRVLEGPHVGALPLTIDFGNVETIGSHSRAITVRNVGTEPLTINQISAPDVPFALAGLPVLPTVLQPFQSFTFTLTISSGTAGTFSSSVSVSSNDPDDPVRTVNVTAQAVEVRPADLGLLYASTGGQDGGRLLYIDPSSGAGTFIGDPVAERLPGLAVDSNGRIFAAAPEGVLYLLDASDGSVVRTLDVGVNRMAALAFDDEDVLYAVGFTDFSGIPTLFTIDTSTGSRTALASLQEILNGMSFHPVDGTLWAATADQIFTVDVTTGQVTSVGFSGLRYITDVQFDIDGNLYATAGGGREENRLVLIDQTSGVGTVIGEIGFSSVSGLSARLGQLEGPQLAFVPPRVDFGQLEVDGSRTRAVVMRSVGTEGVTITAISNLNAPLTVVQSPTLPLLLEPGDTDTLLVRFTPTAGGQFDDSLTVSSNDADNPERLLTVRGEGYVLTFADVGVLYGSTGTIDGGRLIAIDPVSGAGTLIGNPASERLPGLAIDSQGRIWAGDDSGSLHLLDAATGEIRRSVATGLSRLPAISFDDNDVMHAFARDPNSGQPTLYRLDPEAGTREIVTRTQFEFRGMSFNPLDRSLWATTNTAVYSVDVTTGEATFLTEPWYTPDLQFDLDGNLFVLSGGGVGDDTQLLLVDQASGATSEVGLVGFASVSGLATRLTALDGPHLAVMPSSLDFGDIEVGDSRTRTLILRNVGTEVVTVSAVSDLSAPFSLSGGPAFPFDLEPGRSDTLKITFTATAAADFESNLTTMSSDADEPEKIVSLRGGAFVLNRAVEAVFYGSTGNIDGGRLIRIDPSNGAGTVVGATGVDRLPGLAIDSDGRIYAADPEGRIYLLDAADGSVKRTLQIGLFGMAAITFDQSDVLHAFAYSDTGPALFAIDTESGRRTLIGPTDTEVKGASFHPFDNSLWTAGPGQINEGTAIYQINPGTGEAVLAGSVSLPHVTDIQFDLSGALYATAGGGREENQLVLIDQTNWTTTVLGPIGVESVSGLGMRLTAAEGAHLVALPDRFDFLETRVGGSKTGILDLLSIGTETVTIQSLSLPEAPFRVDGAPTSAVALARGEKLTLSITFEPSSTGSFDDALVVNSNDADNPQIAIPLTGSGGAFAVDGDLSDEEYKVVGVNLFPSSFGPEVRVTRIQYAVVSDRLYLGFQSRVQNVPNTFNLKPDGLGFLLNSAVQSGAPAGTALGIQNSTDFHFLNGNAEAVRQPHLSFAADFEVDYMFAAYSDATPDKLILDVGTHVDGKDVLLQRIGETGQGGTATVGPSVDGVFPANSIRFAFQPSATNSDLKGLEISIPLTELSVSATLTPLEIFAFTVSSTAFFSNNFIPGNSGHSTSLGFEPNFSSNLVSQNCACFARGETLGTGPFHASIEVATDVENTELPEEFALYQNYPNPFNPSTTITFDVPVASRVRLIVYDLLGRQLGTLVDHDLAPGSYSAVWDGRDATGSPAASGGYVYRIEGSNFAETKVMVLVK